MNVRGNILIVDDTIANLQILSSMLTEQGYEVRGAPNGSTALMMAAAEPPDLILLDIRMPEMDGYQICRRLKTEAKTRDIPIVFLSALDELADKVRGFAEGAVDYITKPFQAEEVLARVETHLAVRNLQRQLEAQNAQLCRVNSELSHEIIQRERAETALQELNAKLEQRVVQRTVQLDQVIADLRIEIVVRVRAEGERERLLAQVQEQARQMQQVMDTVPEGVLLLDADHRVILANPAAQRDLTILGDAGPGEMLASLGGHPLSDLLTWPEDKLWYEIEADGHTFKVIGRPVQIVPESQEACPAKGAQGAHPEPVEGWVLAIHDITREREIQARARQQDRLAVIGQLAGGVAHDFNNLLTTIQGFTRFALDDLDPGAPVSADLEQVARAANRAAALTRQLLTFSRKQVVRPHVLDLSAVVADVEKMLRRLIGENIELSTALEPSLGRVRADPGQIEQVITNLAVNARDAMPQGGRLTLKTENAMLDAYTHKDPEVEPGPYVMLAVSDTGTGMTKEIQAHLFEPFFTTKERGKGTGLGLSIVYGIVKQAGGHIEVDSEVGAGTTFRIYLPQVEEGTEPVRREREDGVFLHGTETILLVEDQDTVRELSQRALERHGYTVRAVCLPSQALRFSQRYADPIPLLVTDVILPEMEGGKLADQLAASRPGIKVLYISGYTDDAIASRGVLEPGTHLLEKPFEPDDLARKVREVLDELPSE